MDIKFGIKQLGHNKNTIYHLLNAASKQEYTWKQSPKKWSLLEIICHLYDEEREDFRTRFQNTIETPNKRPPSFDPVAWVTERKYSEQNFEEKLSLFLLERDKSIKYLSELKHPNMDQGYTYSNYGHVNGSFFLANWVAHDLLHIKQITRLKYDYVAYNTGLPIDYAGTWT